jgi:hypothetical protein
VTAREVAAAHVRSRERLAERLRLEARNAWAAVDPARISETWARQIPRLLALVTGGQHAAASSADRYVTEALVSQGLNPATAGRLDAASLAGVASDGRRLETLLARPGIVTKMALAQGATLDRAMAFGGALTELVAHTQVADAGRAADGVALATRPHAGGYVRMLGGGGCSRCIVLAGKWYRWSTGFQRHPHCLCIHIPAAESQSGDLRVNPRKAFDAMSAAVQDKTFTKAGAQAIRDGADPAKVVNARRGMQTAADARLYTTEAAGRRPRLMPEQIYRDAQSRDDAIRLLRLHGFIL